jgi:plasmid stabilization system protein ParE
MSYRIVIEERAYADIDNAYQWRVESVSPENAMEWYFDILEKIETLQNNPFRCALALENEFFPEEIRQLLYQRHRILFTVRDEEVHVLYVRHEAQDTLKPDED